MDPNINEDTSKLFHWKTKVIPKKNMKIVRISICYKIELCFKKYILL